MDKLRNWLKAYGLNDTEIIVYLYIHKHPGIKVSEIQRQTGLVRTTIYYSLAQLKTDGLVFESVQNNVKTYHPAPVDVLRQSIETTIATENRKLDQLAPLEALFKRMTSTKPTGESFVARYEGLQPVKQAVEAALRCESKRWHIIAARDNFLYHTSKSYQKYYLEERQRRSITAKTLWEPVESSYQPSTKDVFYRNPRRLPKNFLGKFQSLVILYDDTTLIIDSYGKKTAHAIHDAESTQLLRLLHESIWEYAAKL